jgi:plastocyanin
MWRRLTSIRCSVVFCCVAVVAALIAPPAIRVASAQVQVTAGAESSDMGKQALAFLPSELWVHVNDSVTWTFPAAEIHTVTFLKQNASPQQVRLARPGMPGGGCPGTTPDGSSVNGSTCVSSSELVSGQTYTVNFPTPGNFKLVCLVHVDMTGVVHVLNIWETLPHDQAFYDRQAKNNRATLLSDAAQLERRGLEAAERSLGRHEGREGDDDRHDERASGNAVTAGIAEIVSTTGGGVDTSAVMRFLRDKTVVRVGETVEWTNLGPVVPHTVTFGVEPANPMPPTPVLVTTDSDGARHATIGSPTDSVNSGFLVAAPQERVGLPQSPQAVTRFRVTFTAPGTFNYICALHDDLGMKGTVKVVP